MKGLKTILGIALATTGLGGAIAVGAVSYTADENVQMVQAESDPVFTGGQVVYLKVSGDWKESNSRYAFYVYNGTGNSWYSMKSYSSATADVYYGVMPSGDWDAVIFCEMWGDNPTNDWATKRRQTADLKTKYDSSKPMYEISSSSWNAAPDTNVDWYVVGAFNSWSTTADKMTFNKATGEYRSVINFTTTGGMKLVKNGDWSAGEKDANSVEDAVFTTYSDYFAKDTGSKPNINILKVGKFEIYYKAFSNDKIWMQKSSDTEAEEFATTFNSNVTCSGTGATAPVLGKSWALLKDAYDALSKGARDLLTDATYTTSGSGTSTVVTPGSGFSQAVANAVSKYDFIVGRYGTSSYEDFMSREPATIGSASINPIERNNNSNSVLTICIVISSIVAISSIGFFFLKKKHN